MITSSDRLHIAAPVGASEAGTAVAANENRPARIGQRTQVLRIARHVKFSSENRADVKVHWEIDNFSAMLDQRQQSQHLSRLGKRVIDVAGAVFALLLLAPLMIATFVAIRLSSKGPAIFRQQRHGLGGRHFGTYKFRTMYFDRSDLSGVCQTEESDPRITPLGSFLRRTNIDELPQLWNVLKGDMSLVGPRPHPIGMKAGGVLYDDLVLVYPLRHLVKPGITGLAQVKGFRGGTVARQHARMRIVCDLAYIANVSCLLDIKIIFKTILRELRSGTGY